MSTKETTEHKTLIFTLADNVVRKFPNDPDVVAVARIATAAANMQDVVDAIVRNANDQWPMEPASRAAIAMYGELVSSALRGACQAESISPRLQN